MPRPPRLEFPGAFYHVFSRGNRREAIYLSDLDYRAFESILLDKASACDISVYAWCLMPNHFHLVVETPLGNLSSFMQRLLTRYGRYFNDRHQLVGYVFQSRYRSIVCDKDAYFLHLIRYVHRNPLKSSRTPLAQSLSDWPWSSHRHYVSGTGPDRIQKSINHVLAQFGADRETAIRVYRQFIMDQNVGASHTEGSLSESEEEDERFLKDRGLASNRQQRAARKPVRTGSLDEVVARAVAIFDVSVEELRSASRQARVVRARRRIAYVARWGGVSVTAIAHFFQKEGSAISHLLARFEDPENDEGVRRLRGVCQFVTPGT